MSYLKLPRPTLWLVKGDGDELGSFYLSRAPVTNEEYEAFDPAHARPPVAKGDRDPVVNVSWEEAAAYCRWYAEASGKPFRLPTDLEWEHACRAGTKSPYWWGESWEAGADGVWHEGNAEGRCHEVETRVANPFGLHDVLGLVWEHTSDRHARGGSFRTARVDAAARRALAATERADDLGFRIVRSL